MAQEKNLHRIAFRLTLYLIGYFLIPFAAGVFLILQFPDSVAVRILLVIAVLATAYFAIKRTVTKVLPAEGMQIVGRDSVYVHPKNAAWVFTWGMWWRSVLVGVVADVVSAALGSAVNAVPIFPLVLAVISWYLSAVWLFKYQYGQLRVVSADQAVLLESSVTPENQGTMMRKIQDLSATGFGVLLWGLGILFPLGALYWLWMAFQIGSFWMFVFGLFPPTGLIAALVGAYSLFFDIPNWVYNWFG